MRLADEQTAETRNLTSDTQTATTKVRLRFAKRGDLRLVSHHDLMRCFERMLRRAALPFHTSEGFNPRPRLVFALSLPLGVVGCEELADLELDEELPPDDLHQRLARQAPPGLEILSVKRVDRKARLRVVGATYRMALNPSRAGEAAERAAAVLASTECWVERTRPEYRRLNVRPYVRALREAVSRSIHDQALSVGRDGASDATAFMAAGIPAVEFGPEGAGHHGPEEWVSITSLTRYRRALRDFIRALPIRLGEAGPERDLKAIDGGLT